MQSLRGGVRPMTSTDVQNAIHLVHPTNGSTLCAEPIGDGSSKCRRARPYPAEAAVPGPRAFSRARRHPGEGRGALGPPVPEDSRRRRSGTWSAGPEHLQVCLTCADSRAVRLVRDLRQPLQMQLRAWHRTPAPRFGDLSRNVHLCLSCAAKASERYTMRPVCSAECRPAIALFRRLTGAEHASVRPALDHERRQLAPPTDGNAMSSAQAVAFHDQLQALRRAAEPPPTPRERVLTLATQLGFDAHAVLGRVERANMHLDQRSQFSSTC